MAKQRGSRVTLESLDRKIDRSVDRLDAKIDAAAASLDVKIDASVARLDGKIDALDGKMEASVASLDAKIDLRIDESMGQARMLFEQTQVEIRKVAEGVGALTGTVDKMSVQLDRIDERTVVHGRDIDILKVAYGDLDRRVTRLEDGPGT